MNRQKRDQTLRDRIARVRGIAGGKPTAPVRKRRVPRYQREARRQRQVYWAMGIAGAICVLILAGFFVWERHFVPNQVLATVGDSKIRRNDYWRVKAYDLYQQAQGTLGFLDILPVEQRAQFEQQAEMTLEEMKTVWGSSDTDEETLNQMIDDQIYLQHMSTLGVSISDQDIESYILEEFEPVDAPLFTPTPTATWIPARVEMATQTAVAEETAAAIAELTAIALGETPSALPPSSTIGTPVAIGSPPVLGTSNIAASPAALATPIAVGEVAGALATPETAPPASPGASPIGTPEAGTPLATETVVPTPNPEQAVATAEAGYARFRDTVFGQIHLSRESYVDWIVRPAIAREKVDAVLLAEIGQSAEQVHAAHILVETRDLADQLHQQLLAGADFGQLARENSIDEETAGNGGDLGWFARLEEPDIAEIAFTLQPGELGTPFETKYGWQILNIFERSPDRPLTEDQITAMHEARVAQWLEEMKARTAITSEFGPTPTPFAETFEPPANAPPPPTPTPIPPPPATPEASPVIGADAGVTPVVFP